MRRQNLFAVTDTITEDQNFIASFETFRNSQMIEALWQEARERHIYRTDSVWVENWMIVRYTDDFREYVYTAIEWNEDGSFEVHEGHADVPARLIPEMWAGFRAETRRAREWLDTQYTGFQCMESVLRGETARMSH